MTAELLEAEALITIDPLASKIRKPFHLLLLAGPQDVLHNICPTDFGAIALLAPRAGLGETSHSKFFLCTFRWDFIDEEYAINRALLTVKMKANLAGASMNDPAAGDDTIAIVRGGVPMAGYNDHVYSNWPFAAGQPAIRSWSLTGRALANLNADRRLSFMVQDDTMVHAATLELWGEA